MNDDEPQVRLVGRLLAAPRLGPEERAVIAEMADRGLFDEPDFVERCVRTGEPAYVMWRAVKDWARDAPDVIREWAPTLTQRAIAAQGYDEADPPLDAERLQVVLDLDQPKGWVVALWRDIYADHGQADEIDMSLGYLTGQHLCGACGDLGVTQRDDRFWCAACMSTTNKEME